MAASTQTTPTKQPKSVSAVRKKDPVWVLPSGRRLLDFVIAGGLAAPVLALAWKHVTNVERRKKKARA
jgi:hypothetical protein